jgi:hypothetical protein
MLSDLNLKYKTRLREVLKGTSTLAYSGFYLVTESRSCNIYQCYKTSALFATDTAKNKLEYLSLSSFCAV